MTLTDALATAHGRKDIMGDSYNDGAVVAAALFFGFIFFLFAVLYYVLSSLFLMKIFDKAGVQGKWRAWVPVYNFMVFSKLGDLSPWVVLIAAGVAIVLAPLNLGFLGLVLFIVATALAAWRVGLKLQKEPVWVVLYVLLSIVWLGINAYDKSRWNPAIAPAPWAGNGFFADRTVWQGIPVQPSAGYVAPPAPGYAPPPGYQPPAGYQAPPAGYQAPPAGYQAPPAGYQPPPAGYQPPPAGYQPPPAYGPPSTEPPAYGPPSTEPPVAAPAPEPPVVPSPAAEAPLAPPATEPPTTEPPTTAAPTTDPSASGDTTTDPTADGAGETPKA